MISGLIALIESCENSTNEHITLLRAILDMLLDFSLAYVDHPDENDFFERGHSDGIINFVKNVYIIQRVFTEDDYKAMK